MKIICKDNFDRDSVPERVVARDVSEHIGGRIVDMLNDAEPGNSENFYELENDEYQLQYPSWYEPEDCNPKL